MSGYARFCLVIFLSAFTIFAYGQRPVPPVVSLDMADILRRVNNCVPSESIEVDKEFGLEGLARESGDGRFIPSKDFEATRYVGALLRRVLAGTNTGALSENDFTLVFGDFGRPADTEPRGVAYGGGFMVMEERFFLQTNTEAALVHIIAHEVAHNVLRHSLCYQQIIESPDIAPLVDYIKQCLPQDAVCRRVFKILDFVDLVVEETHELQADTWAVEVLVLSKGYDLESSLALLKEHIPERYRRIDIAFFQQRLANEEPRPSFIVATPDKFVRMRERFREKYSKTP